MSAYLTPIETRISDSDSAIQKFSHKPKNAKKRASSISIAEDTETHDFVRDFLGILRIAVAEEIDVVLRHLDPSLGFDLANNFFGQLNMNVENLLGV